MLVFPLSEIAGTGGIKTWTFTDITWTNIDVGASQRRQVPTAQAVEEVIG
jgi:hypothetical protein